MRFTSIAILALILAGCASVPSRFSPRSAAAPEAAAAPLADLTSALREDPPLPGADTTGWPGLGGEVPVMDHAHHHMGPGGGGMPMDHGAMGEGAMPMDHTGVGGGAPPMDDGATDPAPPPSPPPEAEGGHHHGH